MLKLKELRMKKGSTQQDIANFLNISRQAYYQIENEKYVINVKTLSKLADFFECTTDEILGRPESHNILEKNWQTVETLLKEKK
jgi:DNA-binding XRE family transcriptional regulator